MTLISANMTIYDSLLSHIGIFLFYILSIKLLSRFFTNKYLSFPSSIFHLSIMIKRSWKWLSTYLLINFDLRSFHMCSLLFFRTLFFCRSFLNLFFVRNNFRHKNALPIIFTACSIIIEIKISIYFCCIVFFIPIFSKLFNLILKVFN